MEASAGAFGESFVGEEVVLGGRVGADGRHPGAIGSLNVELSAMVAAGSQPVAMLVTVVMTTFDPSVLLVGGPATAAPFLEVIDL